MQPVRLHNFHYFLLHLRDI